MIYSTIDLHHVECFSCAWLLKRKAFLLDSFKKTIKTVLLYLQLFHQMCSQCLSLFSWNWYHFFKWIRGVAITLWVRQVVEPLYVRYDFFSTLVYNLFRKLYQVKSNVKTVELKKRQTFLFQHPTCYGCVFYHIIQLLVITLTSR
jgi:hypothetical protein